MKDYIYMGGKLLSEYQPLTASKYYYTSDQINSTRIITDSSGSMVYSALFDPYGGMQKQWVNTYQPKPGFSGKERESSSEMDYFGARYYGHKQYRFISPDPLINRARLIPKRDEKSIFGFTQEPPFENSDSLRLNEKYQEDAISNPQLWNLYAFNRNNPTTYFDPDGRSSLTFDRSAETITLYNNNGAEVGTYNASNNAQSGTSQFANGTFDYHHFTAHPDALASDPISSSGFYGFNVNGNTKYGVHAGREGQTDQAGRTGWEYATSGCIRTTETVMTAIANRIQNNDPLTSITVQD